MRNQVYFFLVHCKKPDTPAAREFHEQRPVSGKSLERRGLRVLHTTYEGLRTVRSSRWHAWVAKKNKNKTNADKQ